jgi:glycosyltransferase involved in cell wall biosynthesis
LPFHAGAGFYASLQVAMLRALWRMEVDAIWANDLDTLLPAFVVARLRRVPLVYDSHEFFTEAAGLTGRPFQRNVWLALEGFLFPKLAAVITVNDAIADAYAKRYPRAAAGRPLVVRNMPRMRAHQAAESAGWRERLGIPADAPFLILQGAYLDVDRGVKQAVAALAAHEFWYLVVVGAGVEWEWAQTQVGSFNGRLIVLPKMPFEELRGLTAAADVGLSLDQGLHGNYFMSLPNKLFDYIHAGVPVVASAMPEVARVVHEWRIGQVVDDATPEGIGEAVTRVLEVPKSEWRTRCRDAAAVLHWGNEEPLILQALDRAGAF